MVFFASQIAATTSPELTKFFELYRAHCWQELNSIGEFDGMYNAAILYSVICPKGTCMLMVRDPFELYDCDELLDVILLGEEEAVEVRALPFEVHDL